MVVIIKALLLLHKINLSTIYKAWNAKELYVLNISVSEEQISYASFLPSPSATMATASSVLVIWRPIGSNQGSMESPWHPLLMVEGPVSIGSKGVGFKVATNWGNVGVCRHQDDVQ